MGLGLLLRHVPAAVRGSSPSSSHPGLITRNLRLRLKSASVSISVPSRSNACSPDEQRRPPSRRQQAIDARPPNLKTLGDVGGAQALGLEGGDLGGVDGSRAALVDAS